MYLEEGGEVQRREYVRLTSTLADLKWRPVPLKRDGCLIPNLIGTYLCGAKNGKKTCYRIFDCREMGVEVLEVTIERFSMTFTADGKRQRLPLIFYSFPVILK